jgi:hypothetical protein
MRPHNTTFYVYLLCRPNGKPFYVGKGKSRRIYDHEKEARGSCKCHKCNVIRKIWRYGGEVQRYIVFTTNDEQAAFAYECELIALHGRGNLCNLTDGGEGVSGLALELHPSHKYPEIRQRERNPAAKLTNDQIEEIRQRHETEAISLAAMAVEYDVSYRTIVSVVRQEHWGADAGRSILRPKSIRSAIVSGERGARARFTMEQVRAIRARYSTGEASASQIAAEYGVFQTCISKIVCNYTYHDPTYDPSIVARNQVIPDRAGENGPNAKLTWSVVRVIRIRYAAREDTSSLAIEYGVAESTIRRIASNEAWSDPDYQPPANRQDRRYQKLRKLNLDVAREIRARYAAGGISYAKLATEYQVSASVVVSIVKGMTYRETL